MLFRPLALPKTLGSFQSELDGILTALRYLLNSPQENMHLSLVNVCLFVLIEK